MNTLPDIDRVSVNMVIRFGYFADLLMTMNLQVNPNIPTLATDGKSLWVNPVYWDTLSFDLKVSALAHEVLHKALAHMMRRNGRDPLIFNIACDHIVNHILRENNFLLDANWIYDSHIVYDIENGWRERTEEQIYDLLIERNRPNTPPPPPPENEEEGEGEGENEAPGGTGEGEGEQGQGEGDEQGQGQGTGEGESPKESGKGQGTGEGEQGQGQAESGQDAGDPEDQGKGEGRNKGRQAGTGTGTQTMHIPGLANPDQLKFLGDIVEPEGNLTHAKHKALSEAAEAFNRAGTKPEGLRERLSSLNITEPTPWYQVLQQYVTSITMNERTWNRFDRRTYVNYGVMAPGQFSHTVNHVTIAVDTSGSVFSAAQQAGFQDHMNDIIRASNVKSVSVLEFDTRVMRATEYELSQGETINFDAVGGGGTDFRCIWEWVDTYKSDTDLVIVLTDMFGPMGEEPPCPVLWACIHNRGERMAKFGDVVYVAPAKDSYY